MIYSQNSTYRCTAEVEVDGEITLEVEDAIQQEVQRYSLKYIHDYPMLISPEASGRPPVEILSVKNCGGHMKIDFVFTSPKSFELIDASRKARIARKIRQERVRQYIDEDYGG